jgi:hypothetical protein
MGDIFEQYGIKADAPRKIKVLCLEIKRLQKLHNDWEQALGAIDWHRDANAAVRSRDIWLRMNLLEREMSEMRSHIFMAWQDREPAGVVEEIEERLFGRLVPPSPTSPRNAILTRNSNPEG